MLMSFPLDYLYFEQVAILFISVVKWGLEQRFSETSLLNYSRVALNLIMKARLIAKF